MSDETQNYPQVSFDGFEPILDRWFTSLGAGDSIFVTAESEPHHCLHFRITKFYQRTKVWFNLPKRRATESLLLSRLEELSAEFDKLSIDHRARSLRLSSPIDPKTTANLAAQAAQAGFEGLGFDHSSQFTIRCDQAPVIERVKAPVEYVFVPFATEKVIGRWLDSIGRALSRIGLGQPSPFLRKAMTSMIGILSVAALFASSAESGAAPITRMLFWTYSLWWLVTWTTHLIFVDDESLNSKNSKSQPPSVRKLFRSVTGNLVRASVLMVAFIHAKLAVLWASLAAFWLVMSTFEILSFVYISRLLKKRADVPHSTSEASAGHASRSTGISGSVYWARRFLLAYSVIFIVWCWAWLSS